MVIRLYETNVLTNMMRINLRILLSSQNRDNDAASTKCSGLMKGVSLSGFVPSVVSLSRWVEAAACCSREGHTNDNLASSAGRQQ